MVRSIFKSVSFKVRQYHENALTSRDGYLDPVQHSVTCCILHGKVYLH